MASQESEAQAIKHERDVCRIQAGGVYVMPVTCLAVGISRQL